MAFHPTSDWQRQRLELGGGLRFDGTETGTVQNISSASPLVPGAAWPFYAFLRINTLSTNSSSTWILFQNTFSAGTTFSLRVAIAASSTNGLGAVLTGTLFSVLSNSSQNTSVVNVPYKLGELALITLVRFASGQVQVTVNGVAGTVTSPNTQLPYGSFRTVITGGFVNSNTWTNRRIGRFDLIDNYAMSAEEMRRLFNGRRGSSYRDSHLGAFASLFRYELNEASGAVAFDSSGQTPATPRNLTLAGSPAFGDFYS